MAQRKLTERQETERQEMNMSLEEYIDWIEGWEKIEDDYNDGAGDSTYSVEGLSDDEV